VPIDMSAAFANLFAAAMTTLPAGAAILGCGCLAPRDVVLRGAALLLAWVCFSVPIGVLVGHCMLSEGPSLSG
jgi:hypothetical protein